MKFVSIRFALVAALALGALGAAQASANTVTFTTVAGSNGDGPLAATIAFSPVAGGIDITITNTETGTFAKGQGVSALMFTVNGLGTPTSFTKLTGVDLNPSSSTSWTLASGTPFSTLASGNVADHWGFSTSGSTVTLETAGSLAPPHKPMDLILPSSGTSGPGSSLANSGFFPFIIGPADFFLADASVTASTVLTMSNFSGVLVGFGTGYDTLLGTGTPTITGSSVPPATVPLPAAAWSGMALLAGLGLIAKLRKNRQLRY